MNKKIITILIAGLIVFSSIPSAVNGQETGKEPWIKVFEDKIEITESVDFGNYEVELTESQAGNPHIMIYEDGDVQAIEQVVFGKEIKTDNLSVTPGQETDEGILIIVKHRADLVKTVTPEVNEKYEVGNTEIKTLNFTDEELNVSINSEEYTIDSGSTLKNKDIALSYDESELKMYHSPISADLSSGNNGVALDLTAIGLEAEAGEQISFPVTINNNGTDKTVELEVLNKPSDWEAYFQYSSQRARILSLEEDGQKSVDLIVESPRDAELGEHKIKFRINNNVEEVSVFIHETYRGEQAELTLSVEDDSGPVNNAQIELGDEIYTTNSEGMVEITSDPGEYDMKVTKEGYGTFTDTIELLDGEKTSEMIRIERSSYYFNAEIESESLTVRFDNQRPYEISIDNEGRLEDEYSLKVEGLPSDWTNSFFKSQEQSVRTNSISLEGGESGSAYLKAVPTYNSEPGEYNATLIVEGSNQKYEEELSIELIGDYQLDVNFQNYQVSGQSGETITTDLRIRNYGGAPITNVNFEVNTPDGWETSVQPQRITNLDRRDRKSVSLEIQIPEGAPAGEQMVEVKTKSDQVEQSEQLRVKVTQSSNTAYIGVLVLVLAFAGVIVMMKRMGRR